MATERQVAANRVNGLKGGVKTEEGKAVSRLNARKHGIFSTALTECDAEELRGIEAELIADLKPAGIVEEMLVEKIAATYLRMQRCARAEAAHCKEMWAERAFPFVPIPKQHSARPSRGPHSAATSRAPIAQPHSAGRFPRAPLRGPIPCAPAAASIPQQHSAPSSRGPIPQAAFRRG